MNSWFQHVYLTRLSGRLQEWKDDSAKILHVPLSDLVVRAGKVPFVEDAAVRHFLRLLGLDQSGETCSFFDLKASLKRWCDDHDKGPGTYDTGDLCALFEIGAGEGGFNRLDRLLMDYGKASLLRAITPSVIKHEPSDPGLHGPVCYSISVDLEGIELDDLEGTLSWLAMASNLERILALMDDVIKKQTFIFYNEYSLSGGDGDNALEKRLARSKPVAISVLKNGVNVFTVPLALIDHEIDWERISISSTDKGSLNALLAFAPASAAKALKGRNIEDALGL